MAKKSKKHGKWSAAAVVTLIFFSIVVLGAFIYFGYQTWQFVSFVLPADNLTMKVTALVSFDIMSYIWLAMGLFLGHLMRPLAKTLCGIAGVITFLLSLACSIVQMSIASAERFMTSIDPNLVYTAQAIIIIALVWNICTVLSVIHIQWPSIANFFGWTVDDDKEETSDDEDYIDDDDDEESEPFQVTSAMATMVPVEQPISTPVPSVTQAPSIDYDQLAQAMIRHTGVLPAVQPTAQSPLVQPPLPSQASQSGSQNGAH